MEPIKYIFLSSSSKGKSLNYYGLGDEDIFVGSWAGLFARRMKQYNPELDISIWIMEPFVKEPYLKRVHTLNGIIWPKRGVLFKNIFSLEMFWKVIRLSLSNQIIIHHHSLFDRFILIRFLLPSKVKIVMSHHGGVPPVKGSFKDILFRITYRHTDAITYLSSAVKEYLLGIKVPERKIHFLPVGADFNIFKPSDKIFAREELNLNKDMIYGIYVGAFYRLKSVDIILKIYHELKSKYNFSVIFVGGEDNIMNDLYKEVVESGCPFFGRQKWTDMLDFYNAGDFYIHPAFHPQFGGLDVSWIEALACNIPVMSPQLKYLDFDYSELGITIDNQAEVLERAEFMINNHRQFTRCRETAIKHLDANSAILNNLSLIYESIS